jgi:hypothetical protein
MEGMRTSIYSCSAAIASEIVNPLVTCVSLTLLQWLHFY